MKNKLKLISLLIAGIFSIFVVLLNYSGVFSGFENKSLDWRFLTRGEQESTAPIVIAAIDEDSLDEIGNFPWKRSVHGRLVSRLQKAGASAVVFDVMFYEPDSDRPQEDRAFAKAIRKNGRVVSALNFNIQEYSEFQSNEETGENHEVTISTVVKDTPIPAIEQVSEGMMGFVNAFPDSEDGGLRRANLFIWHEGQRYESLNLKAISVAMSEPADELLQGIPLYDADVWGMKANEVLVNFRGTQEVFTQFSYFEILEGLVPDEWLEGKIVLVGATALGTFDHYNTPFQTQFPGVLFHANVIDNLWAKDFLKPISRNVTVFLIFILALGMGVMIPRVSATWGAVITLALTGLLWMVGYLVMAKKLYYMELVAPTIALLGSYISVFFYRFIVEQKEKAGIKKAFGVYVNPHVVDEIAKNPEGLKLGGEAREMTVMFSDVAGFTSISEKLSPQELVQLLNLYLTAMTDTIMKFDGTVDKYEGDAIMAFWGAPLIQPKHAKQACLAVLENRQKLKELNVELEKKGMQPIFARCGINTGPMNVGNMGSSQKFNYTVMGDSVNLASRLEGANKQYGTALMISESTYEVVKEDFVTRELDLLRVKGKNIPIKVYELVCLNAELTEAQKEGFELYREGLKLYRSRQFKKAVSKLEQAGEFLKEDGPIKTYMERCKNYLKSPPPKDWDGVFVMTTK